MMSTIAVALGVLGLCASASAASPDDIHVRTTYGATGAHTHSVEEWEPCESCEWAVRSVQDFVADPKHQEQLAEALDSVACTFVPADSKDECDSKVDAAVKHAVQLFEDYISPATVCKPVCPNSGTASQARVLSNGRYPECAQCQYSAMELANGKSKADACAKLPEPFVAGCSRFVESNGNSLQKFVEDLGKDTLDQARACMGLGHCEVPEMQNAISSVEAPEALKVAAANFASKIGAAQAKSVLRNSKETCEFCRLAVMEVRDKISDPEFQKEVETYAKAVCKSLGNYQNMCIQYVDEYGPIAFDLAEDYLDPRSVCGVVHMCPS